LYLSKIIIFINSSRGFEVSILSSSPPKIAKYSIAFSKSAGLFFLQKDLNCSKSGVLNGVMCYPYFGISAIVATFLLY